VTAIRSFTAPARRALFVSLLVVFALATVAIPATAKPGGTGGGGRGGGGTTTTSASMTLGPSEWFTTGCSYDATYTWSGFKGTGQNLAVKLFDAVTPQVASVPASGNFTFIFTFNGTGGTARGIYARGVLVNSGGEVAGSAATSPIVSSGCNGTISIGWVSTIPLT
jgi:hypothetical protein